MPVTMRHLADIPRSNTVEVMLPLVSHPEETFARQFMLELRFLVREAYFGGDAPTAKDLDDYTAICSSSAVS